MRSGREAPSELQQHYAAARSRQPSLRSQLPSGITVLTGRAIERALSLSLKVGQHGRARINGVRAKHGIIETRRLPLIVGKQLGQNAFWELLHFIEAPGNYERIAFEVAFRLEGTAATLCVSASGIKLLARPTQA